MRDIINLACILKVCIIDYIYSRVFQADSRFAPSQWETSLLSNVVSHWLGVNLESALVLYILLSSLTVDFVMNWSVPFSGYGCSQWETTF